MLQKVLQSRKRAASVFLIDMEPHATFGEWLRHRRSELRLTRGELAERVGCSVSTLRKIEDGERRPSVQVAGLIANCLDVPPEDRPVFIKVSRGQLSPDRLKPALDRHSTSGFSPAPPAPRLNLPVFPTPLVGRQHEVEHLAQLLRDPHCRLLTLVGPGGVGKTRLAVEIASRSQDAFGDGVYFVPLSMVNSSHFIISVIAAAAGFTFQNGNSPDPKTQLFCYLQGKQALLLADNLEHLLNEPGIEALAELLVRAPRLKLLVTSRESLGFQGEWVSEVQGLPVPGDGLDLKAVQDTSIELFLQSARRADVGFVPTEDDIPAVTWICRLVDGMPLAIELAAAWVRTLSCGEIASEIERGLDFLSVSARDLPARHRSMRAVFDHSWKLLSPKEQAVLLRLSVFQGGFLRQAAEEVAGAVLPVLSSLVAKSLVRRSGAGRYDLHEVIRHFAAEMLARDPQELEQAQARHGFYYMTAFSKEDERLRGPAQQEALAGLAVEMDNFRAAWDWAVAHREFALIEQSLRAFATFFDNRGWLQEGQDYLERAAAALEEAGVESPPGRVEKITLGHLLACRSLLAFRLAQHEQARAMLERSIEILRPLNEPRVLVEAVSFLAIVMSLTGSYERALELFNEGLEIANEIGDRWFAALCLTEKIGMDMMMGRAVGAYERLQSAVEDWRAIGDPRFTGFGLSFLSLSAFNLGRYEEARAALDESVALNLSVGDRWGLGTAYRGLGLVDQAQGEHARALEAFQKSLDTLADLDARWDVARVMADMGRSVLALGKDVDAERIWRESLRLAVESQASLVILESLIGLSSLWAKQGEMERALELLVTVLNHPARVHETTKRAGRLRAKLVAQFTSEEVEGIRLRAEAKTFDSVVAEVLASP